jgi:hypothetical protein
MKITLNLAPAESARSRYALVWAIPATLAGVAGLALLIHTGRQTFKELRGVQQQVAEVQQRQDELRKKELDIRKDLEKPEYRALLTEAQFVNSLIDQKQLSMTELAARIAGLMPDEAHLTSLALQTSKEGDLSVRMSITGRSEEPIEAFLSDLEDAPDFKDVTLSYQGFAEQGAQPGQVNIACTARYLPGAYQEAEEKSEEATAPSEAPAKKTEKTGAKSAAPAAKGAPPGTGNPGKAAKAEAVGVKSPPPPEKNPAPAEAPPPQRPRGGKFGKP